MTRFDSKKKRNLYIRIRTMMLKRGVTAGDIGRMIGLTRQAVNYVITGHVKSPRIRAAIAAALDVQYEKLWGKDRKKKAA